MRSSLTRRRFRPTRGTPRLTRLLKGANGVTSLEFAFIAPILLLFIMGIIEFALIMFSMAAMESATFFTSRTGKTGYMAEGKTREQTIIDTIKTLTAGLLDPEKIVITYTIYPSFSNVNQPEPFTDSNGNGSYDAGEAYNDVNGNGQWDQDMGAAGVGEPGDIVVYNISYPWHINTPLIGTITGDPFNISVRAVVRNEPFEF